MKSQFTKITGGFPSKTHHTFIRKVSVAIVLCKYITQVLFKKLGERNHQSVLSLFRIHFISFTNLDG